METRLPTRKVIGLSPSSGDVGRADVVVRERRHLTNVAYRMLGSLADAEDAVQETFARWLALSPERQDEIRVPRAWLTTTVSRICLDLLGSARARRERYVGEWLPEPVLESGDRPSPVRSPDPAEQITLDESVAMALLVVLETMTPAQRVTFVLHDVFGYSFKEVADIIERSPAACRQLATSARRRARSAERPAVPDDRHALVVTRFRQAWETGDLAGLLDVLADDTVTVTDGGGVVRAQLEPIVGRDRVAGFLAERVPVGLSVLERPVNGRPGLLVERDGVVVMAVAFDVAEGKVRNIWAVLNPEKLGTA